ncbi:MAG: DEAD/DEAH box helicase family protein [Chloroflexi bacterium]|nr:DEAD/DEAH box helicase family protein [Chloroflexota bacterium]
MELQFDPKQEYQLYAIQAIVDLFTGQPRVETGLSFTPGVASFAAVPNRLDLSESQLLANLHAVQERNQIAPDRELEYIQQPIQTAAGPKDARFYNFSVEMETGTGKTYVYLRTALELYQRYGLRKYIVVVPSVAVREGVIKTLQITAKHFCQLYENIPYRYYAYDSANLSQVRQFALSDSVEIMVMTLAAFNKASNVIRQTTDRLQGETPVHLVQAARPILILDEPQNMESEISIAALSLLDPLFALRYSATHRNPYNVIYRLTPYEAYRQRLVKRIEVASVVREDATAQPYLRLVRIEAKKRTLTARLAVHKLMKGGTVKERTVTVRPGDSLRKKTNRTEYDGYEIDEISLGGQFIRFANNLEITLGQELGADKDAIFEAQIRYTIEEHLRRQARLHTTGIKVLSLFFIDRVDNYAPQDGLIRRLFVQAFDDIKQRFPTWRDRDVGQVQAAYFAQRRTRSGDVILEDSKTGEAEKDRQAYELIMKDKERLLSFDEPTAFIFSHSALREGWDNPNVFQICTLNQTTSEMKKRQEVGRGIRLPVSQSGQRVHDDRFNVLTVVANESYERFVAQLQSEIAFEYRAEIEARYGKAIGDLSDEERRLIEEEYGEGILPPKPVNARDRRTARLRKEFTLKPEFQALWEKIKHKTRYAVRIDSPKLVRDVVAELDRAEIRPPRVTITKARVDVHQESAFEALQMSAAKTVMDLSGRYPLPNLVHVIANLMKHTTPPVRITRQTILEIIKHASHTTRQAMVDNPNEFATVAVRFIKEKLTEQLVQGIQYEKISQWYEMTQLALEIESYQDYLVPAEHAVYDHVICDSEIERQFVAGLERRDDVKLYLKLPTWFTVPTPIGEYNPDWAIVMEERDEHGDPVNEATLYLVRETKSTHNLDELRPDERRKIICGKRHFQDALGVDYKVAVTAQELP